MSRKSKISNEQRDELVAIWQSEGPIVAGERAVALGVNKHYPRTLATERGLKRPSYRVRKSATAN